MSNAHIDEPDTQHLVGRSVERDRIRAVLYAARNGQSGVIVLHGEAGMGKTALLESAAASAQNLQVIRIAGVESEGALGYAALHRLLLPFLDHIDALPPRQRAALEAALGISDTDAADRFVVGLAVLTILGDAASASRGLLCLVDDAQWIDRESLDVISFVGRRLQADCIALLLAFRDEPGAPAVLPDGLPHLAVDRLSLDETRVLLRATATGPLSESVEQRIVDAVHGTPLAILELATELSDEQLSGGDVLPDPLPVGARLEAHFLRQVHQLSAQAQTLLLVAATDPTGDADLVWRVSHQLGVQPEAYEEAETRGLLVTKPTVQFRHPLVRSAVYRGAPQPERRKVHAALADATTSEFEADRRAWHRAAASIGPDAQVADELEHAADRARTRGGHAAEGSFRARAAELTPDRRLRAERYLTAAQANLTAGAPQLAAELFKRADFDPGDPVLRAQAQRVEAGLQPYSDAGPVASLLLLAARSLEDIDVRRSRETYADAIQAAMVSAQLTSGVTLAEVARAVLDAPADPTGTSSASDLLMEGFATRLAVGYSEAVPILRAAVGATSEDMSPAELNRWAILGNNLPKELWDATESRQLLSRFEAMERERGALEPLRMTLGGLAHIEMWNGNLDGSDSLHSEATEISAALGESVRHWENLKVEQWAWQGDEENTRTVSALLTGRLGHSFGAGCVVNLGRMALTILEQGLGNYREAFDVAHQAMIDDIPPQGNQSLPEVIEAGVRCGETDAARRALAILTERATVSGTPWALGLLARCRALLADDSEAEALYLTALQQLELVPVRTETARTHLLLGEWLRRRNRRLDAREHLRTACDMFESMGAAAFAGRARGELAATGERARRRTVETVNDLTPQESKIAELAAAGATNREIAANLFISSSTVDYHLRKVFRKLGVSSRRQLVDATRR